ncbi:MAG: hypothetical protein ACYCTE_01950, partial [Acidimicrobiales bacterium]
MTQARHLDRLASEPVGQARRAVRVAAVLLGVTAAMLATGLIVGFVLVGRHGGGPIQGWDDAVERWFPDHRGPLVGVAKLVATYLDAVPLAAICVVLSAIL